MKWHTFIAIAALSLLAGGMIIAAPAVAGNNESYITSLSDARMALIEKNIVVALTGDIPGQQADASQLVRVLKEMRPEQSFSTCVIPLMAIVKDEEADQATRILAAMALDKLESERGSYAIARTALYTDDPLLKHVCSWLTYSRTSGRQADGGMAAIEPIEESDR
jgi:5,10-methylenetetrahydrofolate reductase